MAETALPDVVVLELATGVAGPYCGKLLADLGAQVVKVESPAGDPVRGDEPLVAGESAFFAWLNANKLGAELELEDEGIEALARHADIVIHDQRGPVAEALEARLAGVNPRAVVVSLSPYGRSGPRAGWQASPLTEWATSGFHYFAGDPAREPVWLPGRQAEFHSAVHASLAATAGLYHARETGEGQRIEISHQEAALSCHNWLTSMWTHQGQVQMRAGSHYAKCADGYVYLFHLVPYANLFILIERFDLLADESLMDPPTWWARFPEIFAAFEQWAATRTKQEIYHAAQELRIAVSPLNTMADLAASPQLAARGSLHAVTVGGKDVAAPGFPYHPQETPCAIRRPAPRLGEHTSEVLAPGFAWTNAGARTSAQERHPCSGSRLTRDRSPSPAVLARGPGGEGPPEHHPSSLIPHPSPTGPLTGLRVIEMTAHWAGPLAGRHLGDLGAEVIKIELATKPATRSFTWIADDLTWPHHYNRSGYFNKLNRNKKGIALNLGHPLGHEAMIDLVRGADVLVENNSARVMAQLGLDYETLSQVNPRLIMCSMSGYGATGPERNYLAFGSNIETASGLASLVGYGPGDYFSTGTYYADPVTANSAATAIMAALHARRRTGKGQWIEMALLEAVLPFFSEPFLHYTATGQLLEPNGNRSPMYAPQDVYPTAGRDCWLALTVRNARDWRALCEVLGHDPWADDPALQTAEGRRARADEVDGAIRSWCSTLDHVAAANALQAVGVPAAPVMPNWEVVSDNHLNDRGFFVPIRHEEAGTFRFPGFAWRFEKTPGQVYRAAPLFGEHNRHVFGEVLGMPKEQVEALYDAEVTSDDPQYLNSTAI